MAEILIVEENKNIGDSMVEILEKKGHRTTRVYEGLEGLGRVYAREYDLAILDVALPGIDGVGLVKAIKKRTPGSMTIVVCTRADLEGVAEALRNGAYDYILRQDIEDELIPKVEGALGEARRMRKSGYIYKEDRREDRPLYAKRVIFTALDSVLAGAAFFLAFTLNSQVLRIWPSVLPIHLGDIARLALGMAFCYAFLSVFRQSYRYESGVFGRIAVGQIWRNITAAYLAFLGILFISGNLQSLSDRAGVLLGYGLGFLSIVVNRAVIIPLLISRLRREGRKKIVIVGSARREPQDSPLTFGRLDSMNTGLINNTNRRPEGNKAGKIIPVGERASRAEYTGEIEEIYIDAGATSVSEVLSTLDRYRGRQLEVVPQQESTLIPEESDRSKY